MAKQLQALRDHSGGGRQDELSSLQVKKACAKHKANPSGDPPALPVNQYQSDKLDHAMSRVF
jgi:hypothetical protein